jgi:hypothetical protein
MKRNKIVSSTGLCTGGPKLREFSGHGEQGIGAREPSWYHGSQAEARALGT